MGDRILVTGAGGQVGSALASLSPELIEAFPRARLDVTRSDEVRRVIATGGWKAVINAAAFTDVDGAEDAPEVAQPVNATAPGILAEACEDAGIPLVHLSTDYVFDGAEGPYDEVASPNPLNVYGRTKLEGEVAVQANCRRHLIVRTSWVFARGHPNFVTTIARLAAERPDIAVVTDQWGSPTPARALARILLKLVDRVPNADGPWGVVHVAGQPPASRYDLAKVIVDTLDTGCEIRRVDSSYFPTKAIRPQNSALLCHRLEEEYGISVPEWILGIRECLGLAES